MQKYSMPNPFVTPPGSQEDSHARYERTVNTLARRFIYDEGELDFRAIEKAVQEAQADPVIARVDADRRDLLALGDLLQGMAAHERTNTNFLGAWQATLARESKPETMTREQVARAFDAFAFKKNTEYYEALALRHYGNLLDEHPDARIELSRNISLDRSDIEVLMIDLRTRITERMTDDDARRKALHELDEALAGIISRVPDEQSGKRFELEEIYLLRRLIHNADTGHLASVNHGTPREDLRPDRGSVDIVLAAAGDVYEFQLKTFRRGVGYEARAVQYEVRERAQRKLESSATQLVVLHGEAVENAYEKSREQAANDTHTHTDKFAALEPIVNSLQVAERRRLLTLTGLTEENLAVEQAAFEERQRGRISFEVELRKKRAQVAEAEAQLEERRRLEEDARLAGARRHEENIRKAQQESIDRQKRLAEASVVKQAQREKEATAAKEEERLLQEAEHRKAAKSAEKDWVKAQLVRLNKPETLLEMGMLAKEDRNNLAAILAAKKLLAAKYPNAKSVLKDFPFGK